MIIIVIPEEGDFSFINNNDTIQMLTKAYIICKNKWELLANEMPDEKQEYYLNISEPLSELHTLISSSENHSGLSFSYTLKVMQIIALKGWVNYVVQYIQHKDDKK